MARSSISIELENKYPATPESSSQTRFKSRVLILSYSPLEIKDLSAGFSHFFRRRSRLTEQPATRFNYSVYPRSLQGFHEMSSQNFISGVICKQNINFLSAFMVNANIIPYRGEDFNGKIFKSGPVPTQNFPELAGFNLEYFRHLFQ
jgi:hypothetical protein